MAVHNKRMPGSSWRSSTRCSSIPMTMEIRPSPTYQKTCDSRRVRLNRDKLPARATHHFSRDEALDQIVRSTSSTGNDRGTPRSSAQPGNWSNRTAAIEA